MILSLHHTTLITQIAEGIESGLARDNWRPADADDKTDVAKMRKLFAMERARNIVQPLLMDAELDEEEGRAA